MVKRPKENKRKLSPSSILVRIDYLCKADVGLPTARPVHILDAQPLEYNAQFEHLHRLVTNLDQKRPDFAVCTKDVNKKLVMIVSPSLLPSHSFRII